MPRKKESIQRLMHVLAVVMLTPALSLAQQPKFHVEEASIQGIQHAIQTGQTSCKKVVEAYIARAKAYNGVCTALLTRDGGAIAPATGMIRAGAPLKYPTQTVAASSVFPDLDQYTGLPLEFGTTIPSVSDPTVQLQYGLRVGIPDAGQLDALETLNIRGERSITCKGEFDKNSADGPLPAGAPAVCEEFRKLPDALERAAELDKEYGRNPDLKKLPLYCSVMQLKDWYDAKDMRATGGNDVNFAMDAPRFDSPDVAAMREKGAIIYAVSTADSVGGATAPGPAKSEKSFPMGNLQYSVWGGQACNPYDTARVSRGTSNGSGVAVAANLATCGICEQSSASCKGPASRNGIVNILTTKGILGDGGFSTQSGDRVGVHCKTVTDAVAVVDSIKGYKSEDMFSAIPQSLIPKEPFASFVVPDASVKDKPLKGVRVAIVREFMVKHTKNDEAISDQLDKEIKEVLRDKLGATLVETLDPMYPDDPTVPNASYSFRDAMSEILPHTVPELFWRTADSGARVQRKASNAGSGDLLFAVPGWDVRTSEYLTALEMHKASLSDKLNIRSIEVQRFANPNGLASMNQYLAERGDERVKDWPSWVANATFKTDAARVGAENAALKQIPRLLSDAPTYLEMQSVMRMIVLKMMYENKIDVFVNPEQTTPPYLLGGAMEPDVNDRPSRSCCQTFTAMIGGPEIDVPAGLVTTTYDPKTVLTADKKDYSYVTGSVPSKLSHPMPISLMFWSGPGSDAVVIKVASAYEAATHHRTPPPSFGSVPGE